MTDDTLPRDAFAATDKAAWLAAMESIGETEGYFQPLGARHWAMFADDSTTLLVSFETVDASLARADQMPMGRIVAESKGWSHLCLIADGPTWFRDPAVYSFFDRLVEDAFFEDFDRVVFHGSGMGAYAACAFSVTAPEATVIAVQARATLDPARTGWDPRDRKQRRLDFTSRYGFAPDMIEGAGGVFLIYDPLFAPDAAHAALFDRANVTRLQCRGGGGELGTMLEQMAIVPRLLESAGEGRISAAIFARLWRRRHQHEPYLRRLLTLNRDKPRRTRPVLEALRVIRDS
ncbi:phosphoadenosine phosphosulfate reductase [Cereibacter sp. SYSU M97828]|nr:phosphoadenosine phosphosulfate reductase [Cereibacter flavus]